MSDEYLLTPVKVCGFAINANALASEEVDVLMTVCPLAPAQRRELMDAST